MLCNLCGKHDFKVIYEADNKQVKIPDSVYDTEFQHGRLVRCRNCGLVFINPQPINPDINYKDSYDLVYVGSKLERQITFKRDLIEIEKYIERGTLLDIGCSCGFLMDVAKTRGWRPDGQELSEWSIKYCQESGLNVSSKPLTSFDAKYYDCITLLNVLEHSENPTEMLTHINRLLRVGGLLYLGVPDYSHWTARLLGKKWWSYRCGHIHYYTPETIRKLLAKCGFEVLEVSPRNYSISLGYAIFCLGLYKPIYWVANLIFGNSFLKNLILEFPFGGQMKVIARKRMTEREELL